MNDRVSIIIPSRNEQFLYKTTQDILKKAKGDIEIIVVLEGYWPKTEEVIEDRRVRYLHKGSPEGMRKAINDAVSIATGEYIMKTDAHCMFDEGFDLKLKENMQDNWVVIPRRYSLDPENWCIQEGRPIRDYHYLCYPDPNKAHDGGMHGVEWPERTRELTDPKYDIDNTMSFQGSFWFMKKSWFVDFMGGLDTKPIYGKSGWAQEPTEIGLKTWLGGGKVVVNKKTWYAHLHKGKKYGRGYDIDDKGVIEGHNYSAKYWMNNSWEKQKHTIDWLVNKFWPVPTWPENWKELWPKSQS